MKKLMLIAVVLCLAPVVGIRAQDEQKQSHDQKWKNDVRAIELQHKRINLQARSDEANYERRARELDLEKRRVEIEKSGSVHGKNAGHCSHKAAMLPFFVVCLVLHILLTIWVYQDIRKRNAGSGLWIAITLLAGFLGAALYALARIGDKQT